MQSIVGVLLAWKNKLKPDTEDHQKHGQHHHLGEVAATNHAEAAARVELTLQVSREAFTITPFISSHLISSHLVLTELNWTRSAAVAAPGRC